MYDVTDLTDNNGADRTSNEAIATEFFEEYVCGQDEQSTETSQGNNTSSHLPVSNLIVSTTLVTLFLLHYYPRC